jgi:hypothetical protein
MIPADRKPRLGDIVLYHDQVAGALWDAPLPVAWPAIVTEVLPPDAGESGPRLRLTVFRPDAKPAWDVTAYHTGEPARGTWTWRSLDGP